MTPDRADVMVMQAMIDTMVGIENFSFPARQNGSTKPKGEFAHIRMLEEYQVGIPKIYIGEQSELTTTFNHVSPSRLRYRIGVVGTDGLASTKILHGWTGYAIKALMMQTGYGFIKCTPLSNEDAKLEKEWEYRKGFSIEMYVTRHYVEVVDNITSLQIESKFHEGDLAEVLSTYNITNI